MLKNKFYSQTEFDLYIAEQKVRKDSGHLTVSERKQLEEMIKNPKSYIFEKPKDNPNVKKIVTNIVELRVPCQKIEKGENIKQIIAELKETCQAVGGLGLTANQIGYRKAISYINVLKSFDPKTKKVDKTELILINPKIIERDTPIKIQNEICLSFPGVSVTTKRYVYCVVTFLDEEFKEYTVALQDLESFACLHEVDHCNGIVIFDRKWKSK
jgi:peptide deformylase